MFNNIIEEEDKWMPCQPIVCHLRPCELTKLCWSQEYHVHALMIYRYLYSILYNKEDAKDCLHETFVRVFENISKLDPDRSPLPYMFRIARNVAYNLKRGQRPFISLDLVSDCCDSMAVSENEILQDIALTRAVEWIMEYIGLDENQSTIFVYTAVDSLKPKDIAILLDEPPARVRKQLHLLRQQIRSRINRSDLNNMS
jgi:RNA polymerase sigma-70 factor (ECF subfamily)